MIRDHCLYVTTALYDNLIEGTIWQTGSYVWPTLNPAYCQGTVYSVCSRTTAAKF